MCSRAAAFLRSAPRHIILQDRLSHPPLDCHVTVRCMMAVATAVHRRVLLSAAREVQRGSAADRGSAAERGIDHRPRSPRYGMSGGVPPGARMRHRARGGARGYESLLIKIYNILLFIYHNIITRLWIGSPSGRLHSPRSFESLGTYLYIHKTLGTNLNLNLNLGTNPARIIGNWPITRNAGDTMCPLRINSAGSWLLYATNAPILSNRSLSTFLPLLLIHPPC
eukprot:SAG31_NODE_1654_length_7621_cov_3.273597_9_plen_224_part_00